MGTFLEDFKKAIGLGTSLDSFLKLNPDHPLALGMKKIHLALKGQVTPEEAIQYANQINYKDYEVEEQLIFLELLFHVLIQSKGIKSALPILAAAKRLVTPKLQVEWQTIPLSLEGVLHFNEGNFKKQVETLEKELNILEFNSGRYIFLYWTYLILLAFLNQYEKLDLHIKKFLELKIDKNIPVSIEYIYLIINEEKGNFQENESLAAYLKTKNLNKIVRTEMEHYDDYLQVILHQKLPVLDEQKSENWNLLSLYYLLVNAPAKSLFFAHQYANLRPDYKVLPNFSSFYLIRAELANKNLNTAEYLLESRKRIGNTSIYDDFFWFRIFHSKGDSIKAQLHFNLFSATVEKYNLDNRFDLELKLSPEILPKDIRHYTRNLNYQAIENNSSAESLTQIDADPSMGFIVGECNSIKQIKASILKFATVDTSVLIIGETGTGKELIAKALWLAGPYKNKPFIPINCGAISDHLLQSELFGHKKGAFTGAFHDHKGVFEEARDGIVFLDEIGEISPAMQINLLRILEAREFRAVGGNSTIKLNCKVLAATNRNLADQVKLGTFRQDLQFRLERLTIEIPPLRERKADIPLLINHYLNEENPQLARLNFDESTLQYLKSLPWPGNIRELKNELERIRLFYSDYKILTINQLSNKYQIKAPPLSPVTTVSENTFVKPIETVAITSNEPAHTSSFLNLNSKFRRIEELKKLFFKNTKLTRLDVEELLKISPNTANTYLSTLEKENFISKKSLPHSKTFYYEIIN